MLSLPYTTEEDVLPHVEILSEIDLQLQNEKHHPIRIETGYIDEYSDTQSRAQVTKLLSYLSIKLSMIIVFFNFVYIKNNHVQP